MSQARIKPESFVNFKPEPGPKPTGKARPNLQLWSRLFAASVVVFDATVDSTRMEQRIHLKFLVKLGKNPTECFKLLKEVYDKDVMSRTRVFEWYKRFKSGREEVENDPKSLQPTVPQRRRIKTS